MNDWPSYFVASSSHVMKPPPMRSGRNRMLLHLGDFTLEAIDVAPFAVGVDGITFGFVPEEIDEDEVSIQIQPGNFIAYYEPWDGEECDT
jgi:hypothetical protein